VCLQETNRSWEKFLREQQSVTEAYPHIRFLHHRWRHGGRAILSKLPLGKSDVVSKEVFFGWYPAWKISVIVDERISELEIINLHLRAAFPSLPWKVEEQRLQEVKTHCECLLEVSVCSNAALNNRKSSPFTPGHALFQWFRAKATFQQSF